MREEFLIYVKEQQFCIKDYGDGILNIKRLGCLHNICFDEDNLNFTTLKEIGCPQDLGLIFLNELEKYRDSYKDAVAKYKKLKAFI